MAEIRHYWKGLEVSPDRWQGLNVIVDFKNKKEPATITLDALEFGGEVATLMTERFLEGLNGGVGAFEGDEYRIEIGDIGNPAFVFNGYLDYARNFVQKDCRVAVALEKEQSIDWVERRADGISYEFLFSQDGNNTITENDFVDVPYIINYIPDGLQLITLSISTYMMVKELVEVIKSIGDRIADLTDAATPVVGISAGFGAGVVTAYDIGNIIMAALKLAITIAYAIAIVFAIVELIKQIFEQLAPLKRFHKGMSLYSLFKLPCDYLGLDFESELLEELDRNGQRWVLIPSKDHKGGKKPIFAPASWREVGYPVQRDGISKFGDAIRICKAIFNAEIKIIDNVLRLERRDYWKKFSGYMIPSVFNNQENLALEKEYNTNELLSNYNISWRHDTQDQNTLDNTLGLSITATTTPIVINNPKLVNITGSTEVDIPFSLPVRKEELTIVEEFLKGLLTAADFLTGQLGSEQSLSANFKRRVHTLHLSSHFLTIPKMVVMSGSKLAPNQRQTLGAESFYNRWHSINSFVDVDDGSGNLVNNQHVIIKNATVPFCPDDFRILQDNNFAKTEDGVESEVETIEWNPESDTAKIDYRINEKYTNNLKIALL